LIFGGLGNDFTDQPVSTVDVAPTLLRAAGVGADLKPLDGRPLPREGVGSSYVSSIRWGREQQAIRRGDDKLIVLSDGTWRLFELGKDPREALPIRPGDPQVDQLKRSLGAELERPGRGARWDNRESVSRRLGAWLLRIQQTSR
jgi:arylsulfatase A-like enzyme